MTFPQSSLPIPDRDENSEERYWFPVVTFRPHYADPQRLISVSTFRLTLGSTQHPRLWDTRGFPSGVEQPEPGTDHTYICTRVKETIQPYY